jgi:hypothetical protein
MLNRAPIFINGFSYGGTNLLMNLLVSHPDVCMLSGETHEIFYSKPRKLLDKAVRRLLYLPVQAASMQPIFWKNFYEGRKRLPGLMKSYVDLIFYIDKITTDRNDYKSERIKYTPGEIRSARFLSKSVNGVVLASDVFSAMYPDATFIALVRNGFALCEGYVRRGFKASHAGRIYNTVCQKMIHDSEHLDNYHIVRFEEMVTEPMAFLKKIYGYADLDISKVAKIRLQAKRVMDQSGSRNYAFGGNRDREVHWFDIEEIDKYIRKDINKNQMLHLSEDDKKAFLKESRGSLEYFGYI